MALTHARLLASGEARHGLVVECVVSHGPGHAVAVLMTTAAGNKSTTAATSVHEGPTSVAPGDGGILAGHGWSGVHRHTNCKDTRTVI